LSSTYPDDLENNFSLLKGIISEKFPGSSFGDESKSSENSGYGNKVYFISAPLEKADAMLSDREFTDAVTKERFKIG
jgi:hypothetical protein